MGTTIFGNIHIVHTFGASGNHLVLASATMLAHLRHPHKDAEFCHPFFGITDSLGHHDAGILGASGEVDANHQYKLASTKTDGNMTNPCSGRNKSYLTSENQSTLYINLVYPPFFSETGHWMFFFHMLEIPGVGGTPFFPLPRFRKQTSEVWAFCFLHVQFVQGR